MSTSKSSSERAVSSSAKTCSSGLNGYESSDLDWKKTDPPSALSTSSSSSGSYASSSASSTSSSSSDVSSSASASAVPLPGPAAQQVQQAQPSDISQYGGTYAVNNAGRTLAEFRTGH